MPRVAHDVEDSPQHPQASGYPAVAAFIARDKDRSTAIYRRFHRLSARNLLNLENELLELEAKQDNQDAEDRRLAKFGDRDAVEYIETWEKAREIGNVERLKLVEDIRGKLKEYRISYLQIGIDVASH